MGGLGLIAQPLVIALSMGLWIFDNGQSILHTQGIAQSPDGLCAAPKVAEFSVVVQVDRTPNNVIMDMGFVDMGADNESVFALGEPLGKFHAQPVCLLRCDLAGAEGLTDVILPGVARRQKAAPQRLCPYPGGVRREAQRADPGDEGGDRRPSLRG